MSIFPITPLVRQVQSLILATFDVPEQIALDHAAELVALAEDWGGPEKAAQLDWSYRLKQTLGEQFPWKSAAERVSFRREQEDRYKAYDFLVKRPDRA
ncbi:MAG: hypothetical protein ACO1QS_14560 [Verrucomicrobiota bacterium]